MKLKYLFKFATLQGLVYYVHDICLVSTNHTNCTISRPNAYNDDTDYFSYCLEYEVSTEDINSILYPRLYDKTKYGYTDTVNHHLEVLVYCENAEDADAVCNAFCERFTDSTDYLTMMKDLYMSVENDTMVKVIWIPNTDNISYMKWLI